MDTHGKRNNGYTKESNYFAYGLPLPFRPCPSDGERLVKPASPGEAISEKTDIRNQKDVKKNGAPHQISHDAGKIPEEWRFELGMESHPIEPDGST
jgi:hypothetical protein